jgi:hypothetical protein
MIFTAPTNRKKMGRRGTAFGRCGLGRMTVLFAAVLGVSLLLVSSMSFAEDVDSDRWAPERDDVLNVKLGVGMPALNMTAKATRGDGTSTVDYLPNTSSKTFVGLGYRNLGFYISKSNPRSNDEITKHGSGDSTDLFLQLFGRTWTQQYFYQSYRGYYINNSSVIDPSLAPDTFLQRPDISTTHYGADFIYNFQPGNYSTGAAFSQSGRQLRSGGAWLGLASIHDHSFRASPQLLPTQVADNFAELATLQRGDLFHLSLGGGGGYTYTSDGHWFATGQFLLGVSAVYQNFETVQYRYSSYDFGTLGIGTLAAGYNGTNQSISIEVMADTSSYNLPAMELQISSQQVLIQYGYRFEGVSLPLADRWSAWLD